MGFAINVKGDFRGQDVQETLSYLEALIEDASGERPKHVVEHTNRQSSEEKMRQLRRLQQ